MRTQIAPGKHGQAGGRTVTVTVPGEGDLRHQHQYSESAGAGAHHRTYAQGLEVASKYYARWPGDTTQYLFSAVEGNFYLPDGAGALLNARLRSHGIGAGGTITITMLTRCSRSPTRTRRGR